MLNLFQIAAENDSQLLSRLGEAKRASVDGGALLDAFADCIYNTGRISINMRPSVLTDLIARRKYQNIYEWANEHSTLSSRSVAEILREKLGRYYERRVHFDDSFENGRAFRYGLLNIGGVGADRHGQFCIVLKADFVQADTSVAYLKGDSLNAYMRTDTEVNDTVLRQDVATQSHRHHLAAVNVSGSSHASWIPSAETPSANELHPTTPHKPHSAGRLRIIRTYGNRLELATMADFCF